MIRKKAIIMLAFAFSASLFSQEKLAVKVWATKLEQGNKSPIYEVNQNQPKAKGNWKNLIYLKPEVEFQTIEGIGGAFNENGGEALLSLDKKGQKEVLENLFSKEKGAFTFCRTAIGASDFGLDAYSYSNVPNDYKMKHFSINRDKKYVLPYLKGAVAINKDLTIFASPWSPPAWMKQNESMTGLTKKPNTMKTDKKIMAAYALYFAKYVKAYAKEGVTIDRICIQNENDANTKYTSNAFRAKEMVAFANEFMIPQFKKSKLKTGIYAGTLRASDQMDLMDFTQLQDIEGIDGVGIQYTSSVILNDATRLVPGLKMFHTEGRCYNGKNTTEQAMTRLDEVAGYINAGCTAYSYWNMVLNETTKSAWDWPQNSLININRTTKEVVYNPDYNAMYIISKFIQPGDKRIAALNRGSYPMIAVKAPNGDIKVLIQNPNEKATSFKLEMDGKEAQKVIIPGNEIVALLIKH
ncbi:glycoside hydrolase family 30 protein [Wenyingzhuangia sp. IMCC45574]